MEIMTDYSHLSNKELAESIAFTRKQLGGEFRWDEGTDEKTYSMLKNQLNEMEKEAKGRGIGEPHIWDARFRGEERERRILRDMDVVKRISSVIATSPVDLFDSEINALGMNPDLKYRIYETVNDMVRGKIREYECLKRMDGDTEILSKHLGKEIASYDEWESIRHVTNTLSFISTKTEHGIQNLSEIIFSSMGPDRSYGFKGIVWNIFWVEGRYVMKEYARGVEFLLGKRERGEKHEVKLPDLLDFSKVKLIATSFRSPTFVQWFYDRQLPAYSWSASSGEEMMKALTTGDYRKGYDAERRLIERAIKNIGERYG